MSLNAYTTLIRPVVTEKSTMLAERGQYVFEVARDANKVQIKQAVEEAFASRKIRVRAVNVLRVPGKERRFGRHFGMSAAWKKAIVTLEPGQSLDLLEGL